MEVRLKLDDEFINEISQSTGIKKSSDIIAEALTVYHWAINQRKQNRQIYSGDSEASSYREMETPGLSRVKYN